MGKTGMEGNGEKRKWGKEGWRETGKTRMEEIGGKGNGENRDGGKWGKWEIGMEGNRENKDGGNWGKEEMEKIGMEGIGKKELWKTGMSMWVKLPQVQEGAGEGQGQG